MAIFPLSPWVKLLLFVLSHNYAVYFQDCYRSKGKFHTSFKGQWELLILQFLFIVIYNVNFVLITNISNTLLVRVLLLHIRKTSELKTTSGVRQYNVMRYNVLRKKDPKIGFINLQICLKFLGNHFT